MRNPFAAGGFLVISLTILTLIGYSIHQKDLRVKAEAALVEAGVELEGAKKAILVAPKEIIKFVEVPSAVKAAVKTGAMTPIAAGKVTATSDTILVPCPDPSLRKGQVDKADNSDTIIFSDSPPPKPDPTTVPLTFGLTGEVFLGAIKHGAIEHTVSLKATVWGNDGWHSTVPFKPENVAFDVVFSKEVQEAIEEHEQPWLKRHTALMCPGVGVVYNPLDTGRPVNVGLVCAYGFTWF